jgi:hypothetical protein
MLYADKYDNHFLHIVSGRARFATFARFTLNGLLLPGTPAALLARALEFETSLTRFANGVVKRTAGAGSAKGGTATEVSVWTQIKAFIHTTDIEKVQPSYHASPADQAAIYPDKLGGLTQAKKDLRLSRFEAYAQALLVRADTLTNAPAQTAQALLSAYRTAADATQSSQKAVDDTIAGLGLDAVALCEQLWEVHTLALYTFRATPDLAASFFDYDLLPQNKRPPVVPPVA